MRFVGSSNVVYSHTLSHRVSGLGWATGPAKVESSRGAGDFTDRNRRYKPSLTVSEMRSGCRNLPQNKQNGRSVPVCKTHIRTADCIEGYLQPVKHGFALTELN